MSLPVVAARDQKWRVASDKSGLLSLLQSSTKKITWSYNGNMAIGFDTNANEQCIPILGHVIFALYWVFQLRCQDGNTVLHYNSAEPTGIK